MTRRSVKPTPPDPPESAQARIYESVDELLSDTRRRIADQVRQTVRQLLAGAQITQTTLGKALGYSQPSVSHMLGDRTYEPTPTEIYRIEQLVQVPIGTVYRLCGLCHDRNVEELIYGDPSIDPAAADLILGAIVQARTYKQRVRTNRRELAERVGLDPDAYAFSRSEP